MTNFRIVNQSSLEEKLLLALFLFLGLKGITKGFILGSVFILCLFFYSCLIDALWEVTSHIGSLWMQSDSITKLLMLCLAVYAVRKGYPYAVKLHKKGV